MHKNQSAREERRLGSKELLRATGLRVPVILIESTSLFREGLMRILQKTRFEVIEAVDSVAALSPTHVHAPELVLIGTGADAAATAREIDACRRRFPSARRIVVNDRFDRHSVVLMLESGVSAYLGKAVTTEVLLMSLELVTLGAMVFSAPRPCCHATSPEHNDLKGHPTLLVNTDQLAECDVAHRLSTREIDILHCLVQGEPNKLIARKFQITEATVKVHIKAILRKIRAANRTQAAIWAMSHLSQEQTLLAPEPLEDRVSNLRAITTIA
jgi:two-component system nitrate/nitrite response regulator NarL